MTVSPRTRRLLINLIVFAALCLIFLLFAFKYAEEIAEFKYSLHNRDSEQTTAEPAEPAVEEPEDFSAYPAMAHAPDDWCMDAPLIYHACGGIDGLDYTNSKEALESVLQKGNRYIEVDFEYTSDGELVCCHSWGDLGIEEPMDLAAFKTLKIYGKYTPLTAEDIVRYMERYPDLYIIVDAKSGLPDVLRSFTALTSSEDVLDRLIIQVYQPGEKAKIMEIYPFPESNILLTVYKLGVRDVGFILDILYRENISVLTMPYSYPDEEMMSVLNEKNILVYAHTVNRPDQANELIALGVHGLYTDFLSPDDLDR